MKVLIVNPILYTCETAKVFKQNSIKDTMVFGLCQEFARQGVEVTLYACSDFKPLKEDDRDFQIVYDKAILKSIFHPNNFPFLPHLQAYLKHNYFDFIICSEAFSLSTYTCVRLFPKRTIIWQELAAFQKKFHQIPAKFWYQHIVRNKFKGVLIVARSERARNFILKFSNDVSKTIIDHGVDTSLFHWMPKKNQFIVVSQLIERKQVNKIINAFDAFLRLTNDSFVLKIAGEGELESDLKQQASKTAAPDKILFLGKLSHEQLSKELGVSLAMLVYTKQDNSMISISESLACGTPVVTTNVPFGADEILKNNLGVVSDNWDGLTLFNFVQNKTFYLDNCKKKAGDFGIQVSVQQFLGIIDQQIKKVDKNRPQNESINSKR